MDIKELTIKTIEEEENNLLHFEVKDSLIDVFRNNILLWDSELFPLLKIQRKNQYEFLRNLLARAGYSVSVDQVGAYLFNVRKEVNKKKKGGA